MRLLGHYYDTELEYSVPPNSNSKLKKIPQVSWTTPGRLQHMSKVIRIKV